MTKVFVIDAEDKPLLPTHPARARKLLNRERATVERVIPFTIRLKRVVNDPTGTFTVGIDDGAKEAGVAVVNEKTQEVVFKGTIRLRQDVSKKMLQRAQYRRTRRGRKVRHRKPRFDNRGKSGWIPPTIRQKKDSILRVLKDIMRICPIIHVVVEQGQFDTHSLVAGRKLNGVEYQIPDAEGKRFRAKVLWRDKYTCQHCKGKKDLRAHHITPRSQGGTDTPNNGLTLCKKCHDEFHDGVWELKKRARMFKYPAHLNVGKTYLFQELQKLDLQVKRCYGWMTSYWRKQIGLEKTHPHDAIAMICRNYLPTVCHKDYLIIPKRRKIWDENPTKSCKEKNGFQHWDLIKVEHRTKGNVVGSIRSLKKKAITLRTAWDDNFPVSYKKSKLLYRFNKIILI